MQSLKASTLRPPCPLWVISGHFAMRKRCLLYPESSHSALQLECPLRANSGLMHGSKQRLYSITSSARTSSVSGTVKSWAFELFSRNEAPMARLYWQHDPMKAR